MNPGDTSGREAAARQSVPLNEGRGVNPGDTLPSNRLCIRLISLNEGRGVNPGDTPIASIVL